MEATSNDVEVSKECKDTVSIAVIGCGWWSQGWNLPHLFRNINKGVKIIGIVDTHSQPQSTLNPHLESLEELAERYSCPTFSSISELLQKDIIQMNLDGVIVCTPHSTHYDIGRQLLKVKNLHILMEKPMTTDLEDARKLHELVLQSQLPSIENGKSPPAFLINNSANFRPQSRMIQTLLSPSQNAIGSIRHITASFVVPLTWIFDDPANVGWNSPTNNMLGNGFAWGQSSHILSWVYHVTDLIPKKVYCVMTHSDITGADVSHSATVTCYRDSEKENLVILNLSGSTLLPGNSHSNPPIGKLIDIQIHGDKGVILYGGDDFIPTSGKLELRRRCVNDGKIEYMCKEEGFLFENLDPSGTGPESLHEFLKACRGEDYYIGADSGIGLKTVQTIEAMYRSNQSGNAELVF